MSRRQTDRANGSSDVRRLLASPVMVAALLCVLLGSIDLTVVASILPMMISDIGVNTADIDRYIWAVNGYLIAYIVAIPVFGRTSDLIGRQRTFVVSLLVFLVGSIVCAMAKDLTGLVVGRAIQGFGGGGLLPVALALAGDTLGRKGQLAGIGFVSAMETIGWVLGPIYGASVTELFSWADEPWRWVFWLNLPVLGALVFFLRGFSSVGKTANTSSLRKLDVAGIALITIALVCINLALASGGEIGAATGTGLRAMGGTANPLAGLVPWLLVIGVVASVAFLAWEFRQSFPLIPVRLYRQRIYLATILVNLCIGAVLMVTMVNVPVVVALTADPNRVSITSAALLAPFTIAIAVASLLASRLTNRFGERTVLISGVLLATIGGLLVALILSPDRLWIVIPGLIAGGFGNGLLLPALGTIPIQLAGPDERGASASSALMFRLLGMTIGVSSLTALGVQRLQILTNRLDPIVRIENESTAAFLSRQREFIIDHAIPLSVQVIQETFLASAIIAAVAAIPLGAILRSMPRGFESSSATSLPDA